MKTFKLKNTIFSIFTILVIATSYSQNTIKITFDIQKQYKKTSLKSVDKELQDPVLKQLNSLTYKTIMYLQEGQVFYETNNQEQKVAMKGLAAKKGNVTHHDLSSEVNIPNSKSITDYKKATITKKSKDKITTIALPVVTWKTSKTGKSILGYNCFEATASIKDKKYVVYFTKELKVKGSPEKIPYIDGVVLEFNDGSTSGIATNIEKKQPKIVKFL